MSLGHCGLQEMGSFLVFLTFLGLMPPVRGQMEEIRVNKTGAFLLGAMLPIRNLDAGSRCGLKINDQDGIQNLEALLFSLNHVNEYILDDVGINMGVLGFDTCFSDTVALQKALQLVKMRYTTDICLDGSKPTYGGKVIGVVGASSSVVSIQLANFLRLFKIPQISYSSTSPELSDVNRYDYFLRTVPSDTYQAAAIVELLRYFNWTYVTGIYEDTSYGQMGFDEVRRHATIHGICIEKSYQVKRYFSSLEEKRNELKGVLSEAVRHSNTDGKVIVVLYLSEDIVDTLLEQVSQNSMLAGKFMWVGSDAWAGRHVRTNVSDVAQKAFGVLPEIRDTSDFDDYFKKLNPAKQKDNPWFDNYWEQLFRCCISQKTSCRYNRTCPKDDTITVENGTYNKNWNVYFIMNAVYAFGHTLRRLQRDKCEDVGPCEELMNVQGEEMMAELRNVSFIDSTGRPFWFHNNSGPPLYSILYYMDNTWLPVGHYSDDDGGISFFKNSSKHLTHRPSVCSPPCHFGQARAYRSSCCWSCVSCGDYQIVQKTFCKDCPLGQKPNSARDICEEIPESTMDFNHTWAIVAMILSGLGLIITVLIGVVFSYSRKTPVIMASGKELSFVLLAGIFLSYMSSFVFVSHPTEASCGTTRLLLGLCYTICYAAVVVKTNRIYRVFNINTSKPKKVRFISARSQLLITFLIVIVEVAALTTWLVFDPPEVMNIHPTREDNIVVCKDSTGFAYLGALVYPFILMIFCVVYALKTRKTPDGFNETRYITFGCYSFCIMWIAFISIYFSVKNNTIRIVSLCFASIINATVTLITLFVTKVYVVLFRPQKNTRENVMSRRRTRSYETIDINNMSNLSRMVSAVSTWHSVYPSVGSEGPASPAAMSQMPRFGNKLSISGLAMHASCDNLSSNPSVSSAPPEQRRLTDSEVLGLTFRVKSVEMLKTSEQVLDERLKQMGIITDDSDANSSDKPNGIKSMSHRRSLRSFKSRRTRRRREAATQRPRSAEFSKEAVPDIIVTKSSAEKNLNQNDKL